MQARPGTAAEAAEEGEPPGAGGNPLLLLRQLEGAPRCKPGEQRLGGGGGEEGRRTHCGCTSIVMYKSCVVLAMLSCFIITQRKFGTNNTDKLTACCPTIIRPPRTQGQARQALSPQILCNTMQAKALRGLRFKGCFSSSDMMLRCKSVGLVSLLWQCLGGCNASHMT